jgi:hypothetical protein
MKNKEIVKKVNEYRNRYEKQRVFLERLTHENIPKQRNSREMNQENSNGVSDDCRIDERIVESKEYDFETGESDTKEQ